MRSVNPEIRQNLVLSHIPELRGEDGTFAGVMALMERDGDFFPQKTVVFKRALVEEREGVFRRRVPLAGASISTSTAPQIAEIRFSGQKTLIIQKSKPS